MRTIALTVLPEMEGLAVKSLLQNQLGCSKARISMLKRREEGILLDGKRVYVTARVRSGSVLSVQVGDGPETPRPAPMEQPLAVLYEDDDLLLLDKPAGIAVHPSRYPGEPSLENALAAYLPPDAVPHPVSRLDRGTTGVITFAKSGWMHERLRSIQHTEAFSRCYLALAQGCVSPAKGTVTLPLRPAADSKIRQEVSPLGRAAVTEYEVLWQGGEAALVRLTPRTGRTHQLRVHMAALGHPLLGDWLYGEEDASIGRPLLHSARLELVHPLTGAGLDIAAPLPPDMLAFLPEGFVLP